MAPGRSSRGAPRPPRDVHGPVGGQRRCGWCPSGPSAAAADAAPRDRAGAGRSSMTVRSVGSTLDDSNSGSARFRSTWSSHSSSTRSPTSSVSRGSRPSVARCSVCPAKRVDRQGDRAVVQRPLERRWPAVARRGGSRRGTGRSRRSGSAARGVDRAGPVELGSAVTRARARSSPRRGGAIRSRRSGHASRHGLAGDVVERRLGRRRGPHLPHGLRPGRRVQPAQRHVVQVGVLGRGDQPLPDVEVEQVVRRPPSGRGEALVVGDREVRLGGVAGRRRRRSRTRTPST